ncbi:substrate-binding domain-containing protein [Desulfobacter postgatei]|uniref:ABC-type phosphate transport system, periplasmic component n=1 Tax=Desulfobacter postgatei 2ac9 TaxID=879212 RepID=I5B3L0_9BACT|nr:substrate-binding domain-containing protein [Desulfobacter postgatei]EIM64073.1 ABC-type phosphate transport system, periplasmic component [Desulfobacter postgatei 2ac9]
MIHLKQKYCSLSVFVLTLIFFYFTIAACSAAITIGGTGNALGTMKWIAQAYQEANPDVQITLLPSIGSSGAIKAVPKGAIQIGLSARPLKDAELEKGLVAVEYARTPTVFAVSNRTKIDAVTQTQLVDIYKGVLKQWPDGSTIRPIIRQAGDDNTKQIKALSPELKKAVEIAENQQGFLFASTDQEAVDKIENTPGSIGVTSLALLISEKRELRALTLDGVEPNIQSCIAGDYPIIKRFYFILPKERSAQVDAFLEFVFSEKGSDILKQNGNYPAQ